jgi:hypothetical protein
VGNSFKRGELVNFTSLDIPPDTKRDPTFRRFHRDKLNEITWALTSFLASVNSFHKALSRHGEKEIRTETRSESDCGADR